MYGSTWKVGGTDHGQRLHTIYAKKGISRLHLTPALCGRLLDYFVSNEEALPLWEESATYCKQCLAKADKYKGPG